MSTPHMKQIQSYCFLCNTTHSLFGKCAGQTFPAWNVMPANSSAPVRQRMSPALASFLDQVWNGRLGVTTWNDVYGMYNSVRNPNPLSNPAVTNMLQYIATLAEIERGNDCNCQVQDYEQFSLTDLLATARQCASNPGFLPPPNLFDHCKTLEGSGTLTPPAARLWFLNDLCATFFHFVAYKRMDATQRVYVNVRADEALTVMKFVASAIVSGLSGVSEAKIAGPRAAGDRADTIVIYTVSETTTNAVLERLSEYQRLSAAHRARFSGDKLQMTASAAPLDGVSVGGEPDTAAVAPRLRTVVTNRESFGSFRAKLIYAALNANRTDKNAFFLAVIRNFNDASVHPTAPHV
jgi:hypothetical protein